MAAGRGAAAIHVWDLPPALREAAKRYEREERDRLRALDAEAQPNADDLDDAPF